MKALTSILKFILFLTILTVSSQGYAQVTKVAVIDSTAQQPNKLKFGVGFGLNFIGGTNISLAPNVTYIVSEKFSIGGGLQGSYAAIKDLQTTLTYGANIITTYTPIRQISTLVEFAELNVNTTTETPMGDVDNDFWESVLFVGAGYNITEKISVGAKYNVLYTEDESVYSSPVVPFVNITF